MFEMRSGELKDIARLQLGAWELKAVDWRIRVQELEDERTHLKFTHLCCAEDSKSIFILQDPLGSSYVTKLSTLLSATVAHIRAVHPEVEAEIFGERKAS